MEFAMNGLISQLNTSRGGIPKRPLLSAHLTPLGLEGDDWAHPKYHGGPNQALLLIGAEVIDELNAIGYQLYPGALGENLTTTGLDYRHLASGQQFRLGQSCEIELTKLREPCRTLDVYNSKDLGKIQKLLKLEGRGGWYARVLKPGPLFPGDKIALLAQVV
jgi:MOSC domain-containing protein YiiM